MKVQCGMIVVADPCYDASGSLVAKVPARNGDWYTDVEYAESEHRIALLTARHVVGRSAIVRKESFDLGVDSGQMSIVDANEYKRDCIAVLTKPGLTGDSDWYDMCCEKTLSEDSWGEIPNGVVSSTGYGDGCYEGIIGFDETGKAVSVEVRFIEDEGTEYCDNCGCEWDEAELWNGLCPDCQEEDCSECGCRYPDDELEDGVCYDCRDRLEREKDDE